MGLMDKLPGWMKSGDDAPPPPADAAAPAPAPAPLTSTLPVTGMHLAAPYGAPPHDQVLTDKIIAMVVETVPAIKELLAKATKLEAVEPDLGKRLNTIMLLDGFTAAQATDAAVALTRALDGVRTRSESEIATARTAQVEQPRQSVNALGARKQQLLDEIAGIDREISATNDRASQAEARLQTESAKLTASLSQAKAWIDQLARQLTRS